MLARNQPQIASHLFATSLEEIRRKSKLLGDSIPTGAVRDSEVVNQWHFRTRSEGLHEGQHQLVLGLTGIVLAARPQNRAASTARAAILKNERNSSD